jgi:response regulator RpfG family c-di-GMP phosphodiesterase
MKPIAFDKLKTTLYYSSRNISNHKEVIEQREELEKINKNLDAKVKFLAKEVLFVQKISIETIANMVESYDDETGSHIKRIESYTSLLLDKVSVSDECSQELKVTVPFASLLHDIGKLMIPKEILTKKGKLSRDEFEIIKTHAKLGGEVLKQANTTFRDSFSKDSYLKIASEIAMYHHEKWDGSGYPEGLKKTNIPKCARIVAIADVYDALRSKRVYKDAFSHEKALSIIKSEREKSFDPELVDIFLELNQEFDEVFTRLG